MKKETIFSSTSSTCPIWFVAFGPFFIVAVVSILLYILNFLGVPGFEDITPSQPYCERFRDTTFSQIPGQCVNYWTK